MKMEIRKTYLVK